MLDPLPCKEGEWKPDWRYEQFLRERYTNLESEWKEMNFWLISNDGTPGAKDRRKKMNGMKAFVRNWLTKSGIKRVSMPSTILNEPTKTDHKVSQVWMQKIKSVLKGREPGQDESEAA